MNHLADWDAKHAQPSCRLAQAVQRFVVLELSNYYLDVAKDRLYVRGAASADRRHVTLHDPNPDITLNLSLALTTEPSVCAYSWCHSSPWSMLIMTSPQPEPN